MVGEALVCNGGGVSTPECHSAFDTESSGWISFHWSVLPVFSQLRLSSKVSFWSQCVSSGIVSVHAPAGTITALTKPSDLMSYVYTHLHNPHGHSRLFRPLFP